MTNNTKRLLAFLALVAWCAGLLIYRKARSGVWAYGFLPWNLFLAAIPAFAAAFVKRAHDVRGSTALQIAGFIVWILFLPNAPYLVTDFIHLRPRAEIPLWYDIALLTSAAGTGLLFAYSSVADMQHVLTRRFSAMISWTIITFSLLLSGFGIYLGRFLRWNSWDAVSNPKRLFVDIASRVTNPDTRVLGVTAIYGTALLLGYVALRVFAATTVRREGDSPQRSQRSQRSSQ